MRTPEQPTTPMSLNEDPPAGASASREDGRSGEVYAGGKPRLGPALVVVGLAVLLTGAAAALGFIGLGSGPAKTNSGSLVSGTGLHAVAASKVFRAVTSDGEPPSDILAALVVPASASETKTEILGGGVDLYDASVYLSVPAAKDDVVSFFKTELRLLGWGERSSSAASGSGTQLLGRHASSDGFYWEVGVTVAPANTSVSPALGGGPVTIASSVVVRLFEVSDIE
jgi:hypothetical protein